MTDMRNHISNFDEEKIKVIIEVKEDYNHGKISLKDARAKLKEKMDHITPQEIAVAEQMLKEFEEGQCEKEDIQKMLELFDELMDRTRPDLDKDHPIMCYYRELDELEKICLSIEDLVQYPVIKNQWYEIYDKLAEYKTHLSRKQNQLYSVLEKKGFDRPTTTMWTLDNYVRDEINDARALLDAGKEDEFIELQPTVVADLRDLSAKESNILYPTSLAMISDEEFEDMKSGDKEIGFAWIEVGDNAPKAKENTITSNHSSLAKDLAVLLGRHGLHTSLDEKLDVSTGKLTLEQINLIYKHLPVDISYVDEDELVCFYSDTDHRVFPRSKNVIGRNVKNCHPRASVHIVEEIVEKFRSKEQDTVEFWINKPGLFIYIYYVAVRDEQGNFRGVLEMMQDCTHIRSLEGSQTLLTWSNADGEKEVTISEEPKKEEEKIAEERVVIDIEAMDKDTKLKDLLDAYPSLKDELPNINPKFKMLHTPLAKVMVPKATIEMMAERGEMGVDELIHAIRKYLKSL